MFGLRDVVGDIDIVGVADTFDHDPAFAVLPWFHCPHGRAVGPSIDIAEGRFCRRDGGVRIDVPGNGHQGIVGRVVLPEVRVQIIGPVRQEILSGIKNRQQFARLKKILAAFPDLPVSTNDYEMAAAYFNIAQSKGIQGSNTDFLICAVAASHHIPIFSVDKDFQHYQNHLPISLYIPRHRPHHG